MATSESKATDAELLEASGSFSTFLSMVRRLREENPTEVLDGKSWEDAQRVVNDHPDLFFKAVVSGFWMGLRYGRETATTPTESAGSRPTTTGSMYQ